MSSKQTRDKTFGFRTDIESYQAYEEAFQNSGFKNKDEWFESLLTSSHLNDLKDTTNSYTEDLNELQVHTSRIYSLIVNMMQRSEYLKGEAVNSLETKLELKDELIRDLQQKNKELKETTDAELEKMKSSTEERLKEMQTAMDEAISKQKNAESKLEEAVKTIAGYKTSEVTQLTLIESLKGNLQEKNDTLSDLITEYKPYKENFEKYKSREAELESTISTLRGTNESLEAQMKQMTKEHSSVLKQLNSEHNTALKEAQLTCQQEKLALEREFNAKLDEVTRQAQERINALYERLDKEMARKEQSVQKGSDRDPKSDVNMDENK